VWRPAVRLPDNHLIGLFVFALIGESAVAVEFHVTASMPRFGVDASVPPAVPDVDVKTEHLTLVYSKDPFEASCHFRPGHSIAALFILLAWVKKRLFCTRQPAHSFPFSRFSLRASFALALVDDDTPEGTPFAGSLLSRKVMVEILKPERPRFLHREPRHGATLPVGISIWGSLSTWFILPCLPAVPYSTLFVLSSICATACATSRGLPAFYKSESGSI
jgi:hypothetical protein